MTLPAGLRHSFPDSTKFFQSKTFGALEIGTIENSKCGPLFYFPILLRISIDPLFHCRAGHQDAGVTRRYEQRYTY